MYFSAYAFTLSAILTSVTSTTPSYNPRPFDRVKSMRQLSASRTATDLIVDLGYERYQGILNSSTGLNNWFGYE